MASQFGRGSLAASQLLQTVQTKKQDQLKQLNLLTKNSNAAIKDVLTFASEFRKSFVEGGFKGTHEEFTKEMNSIVNTAKRTSEIALQSGLQVTTPELIESQRKILTSAPTQREAAESAGAAKAAGQVAGAEVISEETGVGMRPALEATGALEAKSFTQRVAFNPKTNEMLNARFDPKVGKSTLEDGSDIPEDFIVLPPQLAGTPEEFSLEKKSRAGLEERIIASADSISTLENIVTSFRPEFQELPTELFVGALKAVSRAGLGKTLSDEQRQLVKDVATFKQNSITALNAVIKQITGAQMSEPEAKRIRRQVPDPDKDDPITFMTKTQNALRLAKIAQARHRHFLANGIEHDFAGPTQPPVSLEGMEQIIESRGQALQEQFIEQGMGETEAHQKALQQIKQEFGI